MSLPLSDIVKVDISVSPTLAPLAGFGELLFLSNESATTQAISLAERVRNFGSLAEVQEVLSGSVEVVAAATAFFAQSPQPDSFSVCSMAVQDTKGMLTSGFLDISDIKSNGKASMKFNIRVDSDIEDKEITVDLSNKDSISDVAAAVNTGLSAAYDSNEPTCYASGNRVIIEGNTTGTSGKVAFATKGTTDDCSRLLKLTAADGALSAAGSATETGVQALAAALDSRPSFVAVVCDKSMRDKGGITTGNNVVDIADWCEASKKIFMNTTNDLGVMDSVAAPNTVAAALKAKALRYTITTFGIDPDQYPSASLFARIATVNYEGTNTTITLKFKKLPTITALDLTASQKAAMDSIYVGGFMNFGGQIMYAESRMADGGWLDAVHGLMWLEDKIQKNVFNLLYGSTTKIPYTDTGINMVYQKVAEACQQAVTNGLCGAGRNAQGEFLPNGYRITAKSVTEVDQADKSNRLYRGISFEMVGAGALHNVIITGSFNE
jgi:hypothetical protein